MYRACELKDQTYKKTRTLHFSEHSRSFFFQNWGGPRAPEVLALHESQGLKWGCPKLWAEPWGGRNVLKSRTSQGRPLGNQFWSHCHWESLREFIREMVYGGRNIGGTLSFVSLFFYCYHGKPQNYQGFLFLPNPQFPWKRQRKTKITKEIPCFKFTKEIQKNQGKEGLGRRKLFCGGGGSPREAFPPPILSAHPLVFCRDCSQIYRCTRHHYNITPRDAKWMCS